MVVIDSFRPNNSNSQIGAVQHTGYYALESSSLIDTVKRMHQQGLMVKCSCNCVSVPQDKKASSLKHKVNLSKLLATVFIRIVAGYYFFAHVPPPSNNPLLVVTIVYVRTATITMDNIIRLHLDRKCARILYYFVFLSVLCI